VQQQHLGGIFMNITTPLRLVFNPTGGLLDAARSCEADTFLHTFGNTREELSAEYDPYDDASVFLVLADPEDKVVAGCRLITPSDVGLKTLNDIGRAPWHVDGPRAARAANVDPATTWDIATIAVRPGAGNGRMFAAAALYHGMLMATRMNGISSVVMIMDERARRLLTATGMLTQRLPGTNTEPYLGSSASTPVYGHLAQMKDVQRRINPDGYRLITLGVGLDGVTVPAEDAFRLPERRPATAANASSSALASRG
jgi:hypothetical protein